MATAEVSRRFEQMEDSKRKNAEKYNFKHFRSKHLLNDALSTIKGTGIQPGELAPNFTLPAVGDETVSLQELRGKPVLLHFGSFT